MNTLITNVEFVHLDGMMLFAHAVLIQPPDARFAIGTPRAAVRGFGVDGAEPIFSKWIDGEGEFELVEAADKRAVFIGESGDPKPLFAGAILKVGGLEMFLQTSDPEREFRVEQFGDEITDVWASLPHRVAEYWMAPNMPTLRWVRAETMKREVAL